MVLSSRRKRKRVTELVRFGVSLERKLLDAFDRETRGKGYTNRSEAIRDLIRDRLVKRQWTGSGEVAGAILLVYDHHRRDLVDRLMDVQHDFHGIIISTQHIHLDHDNCLEIVAVKGRPAEAEKLAGRLKAAKGVKHSVFSLSSTGKHIV